MARPWDRYDACVMQALAENPHAACKLVRVDMDRRTVDRVLRRLKRDGLVDHRGAWGLTEHGVMAWNVMNGREP